MIAIHHLSLLLLFLKVVLGLKSCDIVVLLEIGQAPLLPLKPFNLLREFLLDIVLLGKPKVTNFESHPSLIYEDIRWLDISVDEILLMNVLKPTNQLLEIVIIDLSVDCVVLGVHELPEGLSTAMLHLNHYIESNEVLLLLNELVERAMGPLG